MKLRKSIALLVIATLIISTFAACGKTASKDDKKPANDTKKEQTKKEEPKKDDKKDAKTVKVGVAIYKFDDNFMTIYREELEKYFKELGKKNNVTYELDIQDGKQDQATQTEQIKNFIAQKKDVLILNLVDPTAANAVIKSAKEAKIPVVFINREPETSSMKLWKGKTTYVGADATQSGSFQGEMIAELADKGDINKDGKISYIMLQGDPANVDAQQRTEYSIKALKDKGLKVEPLAQPYQGNWDQAKGQEFTASALTQFGDKLEVVFANNDGMAMGAKVSIEAAGRKINKNIYLVGVDAIPEAIQALKDGKMTGTVLNDHFNQSHIAADVALELVAGKDVASYYWVDYVKVKKPEDAALKSSKPNKETVEEAEARYKKRAK